jgi:hypothetical protein
MFDPWGAGAFGSPKDPATRKWRRKPLKSLKTDSENGDPRPCCPSANSAMVTAVIGPSAIH